MCAREALKDPVELAGAATCCGELMAGVLGWEPTFILHGSWEDAQLRRTQGQGSLS